jgi:hypothetical protein
LPPLRFATWVHPLLVQECARTKGIALSDPVHVSYIAARRGLYIDKPYSRLAHVIPHTTAVPHSKSPPSHADVLVRFPATVPFSIFDYKMSKYMLLIPLLCAWTSVVDEIEGTVSNTYTVKTHFAEPAPEDTNFSLNF